MAPHQKGKIILRLLINMWANHLVTGMVVQANALSIHVSQKPPIAKTPIRRTSTFQSTSTNSSNPVNHLKESWLKSSRWAGEKRKLEVLNKTEFSRLFLTWKWADVRLSILKLMEAISIWARSRMTASYLSSKLASIEATALLCLKSSALILTTLCAASRHTKSSHASVRMVFKALSMRHWRHQLTHKRL